MGADRDVALTELPIRGISINTLADGGASHTLVGSDSGVIFINFYNSTTTYNLPAVSAGKGKMFWFYAAVANDIIVYGPASSTIYGDGAIGQTLTGTGAIGLCCMVIGDGTVYYAFEIAGSWATT